MNSNILVGPAPSQSSPERYSHLANTFKAFLRDKCSGTKSPTLNVLEIGAWIGASTCILSLVAGTFIDRGRISPDTRLHVIDPWLPYFDLEKNQALHYAEMNEGASGGTAFRSFEANLSRFGRHDIVAVHKASSRDVLDLFQADTFDFIYIDGSHFYEDVSFDMRSSKRICRPGGIVSGDDLEKIQVPCERQLVEAIRERRDVVDDFHPGVTAAFRENFPLVKDAMKDGFWAVKNGKDGQWSGLMQDPSALSFVTIPPFIPLPIWYAILIKQDDSSKANLVFTNEGIIEIPQTKGPVDFSNKGMNDLRRECPEIVLRKSREDMWRDFLADI